MGNIFAPLGLAVYKDLIISTIVDFQQYPQVSLGVYKDLIISTIVDKFS